MHNDRSTTNTSLLQRFKSRLIFPSIVGLFGLGLMFSLYPIYAQQTVFGADLSQLPTELRRVLASLGITTTLLLFGCSALFLEVTRRRNFEKWAVGVMGSMAARLMQLDKDSESKSPITLAELPVEARVLWPWGNHHTVLLGHLDAAAKRFWLLYDPADRTTAPTNEMVADWLQSERGVSKDKARAIASILRADGLPMGPRT